MFSYIEISLSCFSLLDINECDDNPCDANAECENTDATFMCRCLDGFDGDGFQCTGMSASTLEIWIIRFKFQRTVMSAYLN